MTVHTIRMPDDERGWEPRAIVWDSDAGTVAGEHSCVPELRAWIEKVVADGGVIPEMNGYWRVEDPWHVPAEFLLLLFLELGPVCWDQDAVPDALLGGEGVPFVEHPRPPGAVA